MLIGQVQVFLRHKIEKELSSTNEPLLLYAYSLVRLRVTGQQCWIICLLLQSSFAIADETNTFGRVRNCWLWNRLLNLILSLFVDVRTNVTSTCMASWVTQVECADLMFTTFTIGSHHICQIFYTSTVPGFWKFTRKKHVNRHILNLKYYIFGAFTHSIGVVSHFHMYIYIYVHYTHYQWVKHGLILLKTESCYFSLT